MTSKTCVKCKETKLFEYFGKHTQMKDGYLNTCKSCIREYRKGWYKENRERDLERHKKYYEENKEHIKARVRKNWNDNAEEINTKRRELYKTDDVYRTKRLEQCEKYRKEKRPENRKNRRKNDEAWRMEQVCRTRLWNALKGVASKSASTMELIGCSGEELVAYLETTKVEGKDYTNVHVDHIIPCSAFDLSIPENQRKCFHYTNLQLLPARENLQKSNKFNPQNPT